MPLFNFRAKGASKQGQRPSESSQQPSTSQTSPKRLPIPSAQPPQPSPIFQQDSISPLDMLHPLPNPLDDPPSKGSIGRKISHRAVDNSSKSRLPQPDPMLREPHTAGGLAPPPRKMSSTYSNQSDMYTQNDLETFSFGAAPHMASSSSIFRPIGSGPWDEVDSDEVILHPDTTPRPSVVESQHPHNHQSQISGGNLRTPFSPARKKLSKRGARARDSDAASVNTFGVNSSASVSLSSISRPSGSNSRSPSASRTSDTTPQTSANDLSSDEEMSLDGRHPQSLRSSSRRYRHDDQDSSIYASEDSDRYLEDYDHDGGSGIDIESLVYEASDASRSLAYPNPSQDNVQIDYSERKGSLAIPSAPSDTSNFENRPRENSSATVRRPSRSMEDLHSFAFPAPFGPSTSRQFSNNTLPPAPTSVPESLGDWRDLRKRSIQRDKDLPPISPYSTAGSSKRKSRDDSASGTTSMLLPGCSATADFDTSWMHEYGVNGVVDFDPSEVADVVVEDSLNGRRPSGHSAFRRSSAHSGSARRQSTISNGTDDIMHKRVFGVWASKKYKDQRQWWTFVKEKDRLDDETTRQTTLPERERPSISSLFGSRPSTAHEPSPKPTTFFDRSDSKDKDKATGRDRGSGKDRDRPPGKEPWRGMALESEEIWRNAAIGRFRVYRKNAASVEAGKPPQQRLNITFLRSPYFVNPITHEAADGPAVTIHKHSKAGAFSISRHFRQKLSPGPQDTTTSLRNTNPPPGKSSSKDSCGTKRSNMILLATRKVQKSYTSTNTTRKLESHGLLDDSGRTSPRDMERMRRERDRERQPRSKPDERERRRGESSKYVGTMTRQEMALKTTPVSESAPPDSSEGSSAGSIVNNTSSGGSGTLVNPSTPSTTPEASEGTNSSGSVLSIGPSLTSDETTSSGRTVSLRPHHRRRETIDDGDDEDDGFDERPKYPSRTPHRETYAALPPEVFESAHQENPSHGLFGWGKSRGANQGAHRTNAYLEASYNPPWPVTAPRHNSETRKGIVDDLNMSFQDVGLLPATGEIKGSGHSAQHKRRREQQTRQARRITDRGPDIFETVPPDALYMILPLWPGETDTNSMNKYPFTPPTLPASSRQYLLIWYKTQLQPTPPPEDSKGKPSEKKRSRGSPTSSHDSAHKDSERAVLLSNFHITGRVVTYRELQGSGVRIPDVGLAVSGPLKDAYQHMPSCTKVDDYVLGWCTSHDSGIEFLSEGFEMMGLACARNVTNTDPPENTAEDDDNQSVDTVSVLTPLGRAVMEMAWLGMLAVTSFNPHT